MTDDTKTKIRGVFEEHLGPDARHIGDQDQLAGAGKTIEWVNVAIALETEFGVPLSDLVLSKCGTIDQMAAVIDTIVSSRAAGGH